MKNIRLFADTASMADIKEMVANDLVEGYTTNPTLMRRAGITDYKAFVTEVLDYLAEHHPDGCISFEVFSSDEWEMVHEARELRILNHHNYNMYVKVPYLNIDGRPNEQVIRNILKEDMSVNVTAVFNQMQAIHSLQVLSEDSRNHIVSVFAGRINDTGYPAEKIVSYILAIPTVNVEILWASPRQVYDYVLADSLGCHVITMTPDLIRKIPGIGTPLKLAALATSRQFYDDAKACGYKLWENEE